PLTIVSLEADRSLSNRSPEDYQRSLEVIHSEAEYMAGLVNNLLVLARADSGQIALDKVDLDLSDLTLEVVERLAPLAQHNGVQLSTGDLPELVVAGDRRY